MKKIQCVIRPQKLEDVKKALNDAGIAGMTVREVSGCGKQKGFVYHYRATEKLVNLLPKIEIDVVVIDSEVDKVIGIMVAAARTGEPGDGKVFVSDILEAVRIRTGEKGAAIL